MPSEYDFLFPYSRRLRRAGSALMAVGAFLAGAVCMAVIIALPLWSIGKDDTGAHTASITEQAARKTPVAGSPAELACEAQTSPHIDRDCLKQKQSETQRSVSMVGPGKPGNKPAESAGSPSDQGGEVAAVERPRETTGVATSNPKPADGGPAAPNSAPATDLKPPVPAAEAPAPHGRTQALNVEKPADGESAAAANREAPARSGKSTEKRAATPDRRRARSNRTYASRHPAPSERMRGDRRDGAREFVDGYGVRHIILPRRWSERAYDVPATGYDRPSRATRVIVVRPPPFDDD